MPDQNELAELQEAVRQNPQDADLRYWLGAQLAHAGHYERAVAEIGNALTLQPDLYIARFQLGLLHLTMADANRALEVWAPLEMLEDDDALKHFKHGLEALVRDDFAACIGHLTHGIALNIRNAPLNADMSLVIEKARETLARTAGPATATQAAQSVDEAVRTDFSLYSKTPH
jgi:tetratricopeptide (TPR) repeat protein